MPCNCEEMGRVEHYDRSVFVQQLGSALECARKGCDKGPRWRVIHGAWNLQTYVCIDHLRWALELEQLTESRGTDLRWEPGHPTMSTCGHFVVSYTQRTPMVAPTMAQITPYGNGRRGGRRLDYAREIAHEIGDMWPVYDADGVPQYGPRKD